MKCKKKSSINIFLQINLDKFKMAGQNIGQVGASPNEPATTDSIKGIMLGFYNEYKDTNMSDIRKFSSAYTAK